MTKYRTTFMCSQMDMIFYELLNNDIDCPKLLDNFSFKTNVRSKKDTF